MNKKMSTILAISGAATFTIHLINRLMFAANSNQQIESDKIEAFEWRFGNICYSHRGAGSPVLVIHDLIPGSSSFEYSKIVNMLSENHEVYSIDLLGYGTSDKPNITYTNYLYVQAIIDFIKKVIGKKTSIVVSGDSSAIGLLACHNDPEVFDKIILINPQNINQLNLIPNKKTRLLKFLIDTPIIGTFLYNLQTGKRHFKKLFVDDYFYNSLKIEDKIFASYSENCHFPDYNAKFSFSSYISKYMNANIIHALKEIDNCIYIIYGDKKHSNQEIIDNYCYYNPSIETIEIENTKQFPQLEAPKEVYNQIELFLH